ncbi:MAG: 8-amino-7-oxononanoate synthase [Pseudomonadota bacterium]
MAIASRLRAKLDAASVRDLRRDLEHRTSAQGPRIAIDQRTLINFCSNDYLSLANDQRLIAKLSDSFSTHGFGAGASPLLSGRSDTHLELEDRLASYCGFEAALTYSSGYLANLGALQALISRHDHVFHDKLNHASLIDAVRATRARATRYAHGSLPTIEHSPDNRGHWCVTDAVFSMDGDAAPLGKLNDLCTANDAYMYADDAHGFGVLGGGRGTLHASGVVPEKHIVLMVTFGKAIGSAGAAVLGSREVIDYLIQFSRTFIYDTALPAICALAANEALCLLGSAPEIHRRLFANIARFRELCAAENIAVMPSETPIQPILIGDDHQALVAASKLREDGFYVRAIRPPTVPVGTARLRISINAGHGEEDIHGLVMSLARCL